MNSCTYSPPDVAFIMMLLALALLVGWACGSLHHNLSSYLRPRHKQCKICDPELEREHAALRQGGPSDA